MDSEKAQGGGKDTICEQEKQRFWAGVAQVSAVLAGVASATYVLGIIALFVPLVNAYSLTFTSAWYATLLADRTLIIVQGVDQLLWPPISLWAYYEAGLLIITCAFWLLGRPRSLSSGTEDSGKKAAARLIVAMWVLILTVWFYTFYLPYAVVDPLGALDSRWLIPGLLCGVSAVVVLYIGRGFIDKEPALDRSDFASARGPLQAYRNQLRRRYGFRLWPTLQTVVLYLVVFFLLALSVIFLFQSPPLPRVEITSTEEHPDKGSLLAHSDGYWHVFNKEVGLVAIADAEVKSVRMAPRAD